jgi:hypothetical protein
LEAICKVSRISGHITECQKQIRHLEQQSDDLISGGERLPIDDADEVNEEDIRDEISRLSGFKLRAFPLISSPKLVEEKQLCQRHNNLIREYSLPFDLVHPIGDQVLETNQSKYSALVAEIDSESQRLSEKLEAVGILRRILKCQEKINCQKQDSDGVIWKVNVSLTGAARETPLEEIPQRISELLQWKVEVSDSALISLSESAQEEKCLYEAHDSVVRRHSLTPELPEPIGEEILDACRANCSAVVEKIDSALQRLEATLKVDTKDGQLMLCQQKIHDESQTTYDFISESIESIQGMNQEDSPEEIRTLIAKLSEMEKKIPDSTLSELSTLAEDERQLCDERNSLIEHHCLVFDLVEPIGANILNDCRCKISMIGSRITLKMLTVKEADLS